MDMYPKYKSPFGYSVGNDGIDSYGVNHNGFSAQDEVQYQNARTERENQLMQNYNNQGITQNYPQYGTNFWGDSQNNYGFGSSNIAGNIQNVTNRLNTDGFNTTPTPWQNNQPVPSWEREHGISNYKQNNSTSEVNNIGGDNQDFSYLNNTALNIGLTAQPRQAYLKGLDTSLMQDRKIVNSPYSNNILENDCYQSERFEPFAKQVRWNEGENQGVTYATPQMHKTDQPTKYGISQGALDSYRKKFEDVARTYPENVKDLNEEQAMNLLCQYYKGSRAEAINDPNLAFAVYDSYFNSPKNAPIAWQQTLKSRVNPNIQIGGGIGSQTVNSFNSVKSDTELLDTFIENRKKTIDEKYKNGLINRFKGYPIK